MAISFQPLRETMKKQDVSWYYLGKQGIDNRTIHQLRHDLNITLKTLEKLCVILKCTPNDVLEFTHEELNV